MTTDDRRKAQKIDPLGTRGSDFALRLKIYIAALIIFTAILIFIRLMH